MADQTLPSGPAGPGSSEADVAAELAAKQAAAQAAAEHQAAVTGQPVSNPLTGADAMAILAALQQQVAQLQAQVAAAQPPGEHGLLATARLLRHHLADMEGSDAHAPGIGLADDLIEAAGHAIDSGDLTHVRSIAGRLDRFFRRAPQRAGDDHHGYHARQVLAFHLPDQLDSFTPRPRQPQVAGSAPVPVTAGTVVSG